MNVPDVFGSMIEAGRPWLQQYGLWAVALGLFTETFLFTGFWFPGYGILVAAGYLVAARALPFGPTLLLAWIGAVLGDQSSYLLGYWWGHRLLRRKADRAERLRTALEREGVWLLLAYHYAPPLRALLPCVAGSTHYKPRVWLIFDTIGALLWTSVVFALGYCAFGALHQQGNLMMHGINAGAFLFFVYVSWRVGRAMARSH